ncbi:MAG: DUF4244 domain-containing protein [Acidimicrobiales bacterium]
MPLLSAPAALAPSRPGPETPSFLTCGGRPTLLLLPLLVPARRSQRGQATTEYALVLLGAAAVALLLVAWATRTGAIGSLLDAVLASIKRKV